MKISIKEANLLFRQKKYSDAISIYKELISNNYEISNSIRINMEIAKRRLCRENKNVLTINSVSDNKLLQIHSSYKYKIETADQNFVRGWCINKKNRDEVFSVDVLLDGQLFMSIENNGNRLDLKNKGISEGLGGLEFRSPAVYLGEGSHTINFRFPDGSLTESVTIEGQRIGREAFRYSGEIPDSEITIIVPIYNAPDDVEICIERLLAYTPPFAKILLIDDCSPDERISRILSKYVASENIRILYNTMNMGFTRTVNRGITEAGIDNVVLLNSDARVTPGWLEGILIAASSEPRIATVTAMSDRAGAFSAPQIGNENSLPDGVDEISYARAFRRRSLGLYPHVPTGNGFCMYVSRKCIDDIGLLDEKAFPRGYGEENDFCMRAWRAGWSNIIDDRTYVFHDRSKSFGEAKAELMTAGRAVVDARYPEYKKAIRVFSVSEKIALARNRARLALQDCVSNQGKSWVPRVLFVVATQTGGTPQTNRDLMAALSEVLEGWILRCDSKTLELTRMSEDGSTNVVRLHRLQNFVDPLSHQSAEYDNVVWGWLQEFDFELVHIRHLGWHGLSLPRLAKQQGRKVIYSFHDFYALSSTIKLIDDVGNFLGNDFREEGSVYRESLWPKDALPTPHGNWLNFWRERFEAALRYCDAFVTTAESVRKLILETMPSLAADRFVVIPHGRDFTEFSRIREKPKRGEPIRILVPGHINAVKGLEIIRALIDHDKEGRLEFHILGRLIGEKPNKGIVSLGAYEREDFAAKARASSPHLGIIFSVWDETYCHTLTELWSVGLPVAVLDFPNVADRVRKSGAGWVLKHKNISNLYEEIIHLAFDDLEYERTEQALVDWQSGYGLANSTAQMAAGYLNIYSDVLREGGWEKRALSPRNRKRVGVVCPANPNLRHAPGSTHIRVWERTHNAVERDITYIRMTPATLIASAREKMLDGAIIQRTAISQSMVENVIAMLLQSGIPYIFELDDDLLDVPSDKDANRSYANYAPALRRLITSAAAVTVSTSALREKVKMINPHVVLLPNQLSNRLWHPRPRARIMDGTVRVLYMGTATHSDDLALVLPALDEVAQITPLFRVTLVGVTTQKDLLSGRSWLEVLEVPAKDYVNFAQWLRSQTECFDFAIAPLCETNFNACKSDLKLLDYGVLGLPVIASDVGVYRAANAPCVRLVSNVTQEWVHALREQVELGEQNHTLGKQLRNWVLQERMLEKTTPEFDKFIVELVNNHDPKFVERNGKKSTPCRIAVCVHIFYPHRWHFISNYLRNIHQEFDLFITCPFDLVNMLARIQKDYPRVTIIPVENIGMDVIPFLTAAFKFKIYRYDAVLKLHTKNDKKEIGKILGDLSLDGLLGTKSLVDKILDELLNSDKIGMIGPECLYRSAFKAMYGNRGKIENLLISFFGKNIQEEWGFFSGTMFWIRGELIKDIVFGFMNIMDKENLKNEENKTGSDGQWAHAFERLFGLLPSLYEKNVAITYPENEKSGHTKLREAPHPKYGSKKAFHGFSVDNLFRYKNLSDLVRKYRCGDFFDEDYYRAQAGDILPSDMDPVTHYALFGDVFGLNPGCHFSGTDYLKKYPDVARATPSMP